MALVNADRVKVETTTTGTGDLALGGAVTGFRSFAAIGNNNTAFCCCVAVDAHGVPTGQWETFLGTYTASGTSLARTALIDSSTGSTINFAAGTKHVFTCFPSPAGFQRSSLGLGTASVLDAGTSPDNVVQLDGGGKLPAVDGSALTGISYDDLADLPTLGSIATQAADAVAITGGSLDGVTIGATTPVQAQARRPINQQTGTTYTLVLGDEGKLVTLDNASAVTLTVPPNADVAFPVGAEIDLAQLGAGAVTVAAGSGVTIHSLNSLTDLAGQYAGATLKQLVNDYWLLVGALA